MDFTMHMPVQIFSGAHCLERHGEKLRELGRRCLIMTGRSGAKTSGALDETLGLLGRLQIDATIFPEIAENPLVSSCQQAAYTAELCKAQFIIGIGGGSVMDAAKAAAWLAGNSIGDTEKLFAGTLRRPPLPLVLIGTTGDRKRGQPGVRAHPRRFPPQKKYHPPLLLRPVRVRRSSLYRFHALEYHRLDCSGRLFPRRRRVSQPHL